MDPSGRDRPARGVERGFSLVEVLVALAILALVLLTSLSVFVARQHRLQDAKETILVWQAIANEAAFTRRTGWTRLVPGTERPFHSDLSMLDGIPGVRARAIVSQSDSATRSVRLRITWRNGSRSAEATVIRTDTGGGNLW